MRFRLSAVVFGAAIVFSAAALAQSEPPGKILAQWGLIGTWSVDCAAPSSTRNGYSTYEADAAGGAVLRRDFGSDAPGDRSRIVAAEIGGDGMIRVTIDLQSIGQVRTNVFAKLSPESIRAMENRAADGTYTVREGRFLHNGQATLAQQRCR